MKFGVKQKTLLVLVAVLALATVLDALVAAYLTNQQNQEAAFAELSRDLITWQNDLEDLTQRLRRVAITAAGEPVGVHQLAEITTLDSDLDRVNSSKQLASLGTALASQKSLSLYQLHFALQAGTFSSIAVYIHGKLSHYISATEVGMAVRRANGDQAWITGSADANEVLPLQSWRSWRAGRPPIAVAITPPRQPAVSFLFPDQQNTMIEIVVPAPAIAGPDAGDVLVFRRLLDRAYLRKRQEKTDTWPEIFSLDGSHRQKLKDLDVAPLAMLQQARTIRPGAPRMATERTIKTGHGSFYSAMMPLMFDNRPRLILGFTQSQATTLKNVQQAGAAILTMSGLILVLSVGLGMFWMGRLIDPIVALTAAVKEIGFRRGDTNGSNSESQAVTGELHPLTIRASDEIGDLAAAFNVMIAELQRSLTTLEQAVRNRTAELRQQTRYLRTLVDTLPVTAWLKDTEGRYLVANQAISDACGLAADEIVGKSDLDIWPRELAESHRAADAEVMASRKRKTVERQHTDADAITWTSVDKAPVVDVDGTVLGTVGFTQDITERKTAEMAREAALAEAVRLASLRRDFLAQMSHELRTPLNAILGYAQNLLRDKSLNPRQVRAVETVQSSGQHLLTLINDILDLARIDAAKLQLQPTEIDLAAFLALVSAIIRVKAEEKGLKFVQDWGRELPFIVRVDEGRLRQVLLNLLGNAVKFTDSGQVALRVRAAAVAGAHLIEDGADAMVRLRFSVEDSGIGMGEDQLARIFRPFEQAAATPRREGGAGLGLAISQQLVSLMGGEIHVQSQLGRGSLFRFELDLPVVAHPSLVMPAPRNASGYAGEPRTVLIVDDVPENGAMLMDALIPLGFDVFSATNGEEAIQQAERLRPDLIVIDVMMPVMDGLEATRRIRRSPSLAHTPVIAVTADATQEEEAKCRAAGADGFISKPIDQNVLLEMIGQQLALTWTYEEEPRPEPDAEAHEWVVPPREELEILHRLALVGVLRDIRERADYLVDLDPRYAPFVRRLRSLAEGYQSKAILALVEGCLKSAAEHPNETQVG